MSKKDDLFDDLLDDDYDDDNQSNSDDKLEALTEEIGELKKANKGLLNDVKKYRRGKQEIESRFSSLNETVSGILDKIEKDKEPVDTSSKGSAAKKLSKVKVPVQFDENGSAYTEVDPNDILGDLTTGTSDERIEKLQQQLAMMAQYVQGSQQVTQAQTESEKVKAAIIGENSEAYSPAAQRIDAARDWINQKVIEWQEDNNLSGQIEPAQVLNYADQIFDQAEYDKLFGDVDTVTALTAYDSTPQYKRALDTVVSKMENSKKMESEDILKFKRTAKKPSNLGGANNQKGAELSVVERLANLSNEDFLKLSDKDAERILEHMEKEEIEDGIRWNR